MTQIEKLTDEMRECGKTWVLRKTYYGPETFWDWQEASHD